ncbi:MAG: O-antigen ligase family protein [Acidobacteria bacterium]|nr:O-antigen ligase family protein [Acidobacteriota bacterium]
MQKLTFFGLIFCLYFAVLAFGGMEITLFAAIQLLVFILFGLALWTGDPATFLPWKGPAVLFSYVAIQSLTLRTDFFLVQENLLKLLTYLCFFLLTVQLCWNRRIRYRLVLALIGLGLLEALYGIVQYLSGWQQIFAYKKILYTDRATGTYINPNHFAGFLEMVLPLALALALYRLSAGSTLGASPPSERRSPSDQAGLAPAFFFFFASMVLFLGIFFSHSRMGIFSSLAAVVAVGVLWMSISMHRLLATLVLATFLVGAGVAGIWVGMEPVLERYEFMESDYLLRSGVWADTVSLIREHPLFGTGLGTFITAYPRTQTTALGFLVDHAHNDYLELTAELGIPGALLLFGLILTVLWRAVSVFYSSFHQRDRFLLLGCCSSILAILFHSFTDFNLQISANAIVFAVILGLAYGLSCESDSSSPPPTSSI